MTRWNGDNAPPANKGKRRGQGKVKAERVPSLKAIFADVLGFDEDELTDATRLDDLDADSLDAVELTIEIEERLGVTIDDECDLARLQTVGDWVREVESLARRRRRTGGRPPRGYAVIAPAVEKESHAPGETGQLGEMENELIGDWEQVAGDEG